MCSLLLLLCSHGVRVLVFSQAHLGASSADKHYQKSAVISFALAFVLLFGCFVDFVSMRHLTHIVAAVCRFDESQVHHADCQQPKNLLWTGVPITLCCVMCSACGCSVFAFCLFANVGPCAEVFVLLNAFCVVVGALAQDSGVPR